jgi:hypothetical protein
LVRHPNRRNSSGRRSPGLAMRPLTNVTPETPRSTLSDFPAVVRPMQ